MKEIKYAYGFYWEPGCEYGTIEVEDNATREEIEQLVHDEVVSELNIFIEED